MGGEEKGGRRGEGGEVEREGRGGEEKGGEGGVYGKYKKVEDMVC